VFRTLDASGVVRWSWLADASAQLTIVEPNPKFGWVLAGRDRGRGLVMALDVAGKARWQWRAPRHETSSSSRVAALATNSAGHLLVVLAHPFATGDAARPTIQLLSPDGHAIGDAVSLQATKPLTRIHIWDAASMASGWLLAGAAVEPNRTSDGHVWRLNAHGDVIWASAWGARRMLKATDRASAR
ncbi:MAG: hypothetical protein AAFV29_14645, partial [Myxococcota bacterium]